MKNFLRILLIVLVSTLANANEMERLTYPEFLALLREAKIQNVDIRGQLYTGSFIPSYQKGATYLVLGPPADGEILRKFQEAQIPVVFHPNPKREPFHNLDENHIDFIESRWGRSLWVEGLPFLLLLIGW